MLSWINEYWENQEQVGQTKWEKIKKYIRGICCIHITQTASWSSVVSIAIGLWTWQSWVRIPVGTRLFFPPKPSDGLWGPPSYLINGYKVKNPGCEVNLSPPSVAKVKNEWSYNSPSPIHLYGMERSAVKVEACLEIKLGEIQCLTFITQWMLYTADIWITETVE